ncbi:hypothetical protein J7355_12990 [Endozoicomonas sp. G2_2]|uniref:hypothetical protein n=1 Tax=Endozoicomonas sp. G2_2 TaxID=2821092 RepID=UPI001ADA1585|nr:hypothetical protein [Endozoicomonas sp. G2_2]MBO9471009.1 hypothetical protein [Endozoicomonas sp. G2_2]
MKTLRNIRTQTACALLLAAGVGGVFALSYLDEPPVPDTEPRQASAEPTSAPADRAAARSTQTDKTPAENGIALRLDEAGTLEPVTPVEPAPPSADAEIAANGVDASAAGDFVESDAEQRELNLQVPRDADVAALVEAHAAPDNEDSAAAQPATTNITLNADGEVEFSPEVESFNIFNPDYGLRGFMKQSWINQRVAFQGGLGLDDDRIDKAKNDDLRDNIAVGMGLILAF